MGDKVLKIELVQKRRVEKNVRIKQIPRIN